MVGATVAAIVRVGEPNWKLLKRIDYVTVILAAVFLASLELALKQGPKRHWGGEYVAVLLAICAVSGIAAVQQCLVRKEPFVNLRRFRDRSFTAGCILSFVLGLGLFSATYMTPIFLGFVRGHSALTSARSWLWPARHNCLLPPLLRSSKPASTHASLPSWVTRCSRQG